MRDREQELMHLCNRGCFAEKLVSKICKQRPPLPWTIKNLKEVRADFIEMYYKFYQPSHVTDLGAAKYFLARIATH